MLNELKDSFMKGARGCLKYGYFAPLTAHRYMACHQTPWWVFLASSRPLPAGFLAWKFTISDGSAARKPMVARIRLDVNGCVEGSSLSLFNKLHDDRARVKSDCAGNMQKLDHIHSTFACFYLGNERLVPPQFIRQRLLSKAASLPRGNKL